MRWMISMMMVVGCASTSSSRAQETEAPTHAHHQEGEASPPGHNHDAAAAQSADEESLAPVPEGHVRVSLAWQNHGLDVPMETFHLPEGSRAKLWEMGTGANAGELPLGEAFPDGRLVVTPGSVNRFVLVMRNPTDAPLYFFAAPHHVNPVQLSLGFKFKCLCINHAFEIPPGHTWYRVVELRMDEGFVGDGITIEHALIGLDEARKREFEMPQ